MANESVVEQLSALADVTDGVDVFEGVSTGSTSGQPATNFRVSQIVTLNLCLGSNVNNVIKDVFAK